VAETGEWVSAHIYHGGDLDRLLTGAVRPLVAELGAGTDFFFLRYWDGGPHLRLRIPVAGPARRAEVEALVRDRCAAYLAGNPSPGRLSPAGYARTAAALARGEGLTTYLTELQPDDSVALTPYRPEHDRYGHGPALAAVERHFVESSRIALRVLGAGPTAEQRAGAAAAAILSAWAIAPPGRPTPSTMEDRRGSAMVRLARQMQGLAAGRTGGTGTLADWTRTLLTLRAELTEAAAPAVLDLCAHLLCNRLGVPLTVEATLRRRAAAARAELTAAED
jgi:hypothetical protein